MNPDQTVHLLDDEPGMLKALSRLLRGEGFNVRAHSSAQAFLKEFQVEEIACLVLDVRMPGVDGLELQRRMNSRGIVLPIVFLTGHGDIPMSVRAIKSGAVDFLTKPVNDTDLLRAVHAAMQRAVSNRAEIAETNTLSRRFELLTPREREVMAHVAAGKLNKQIASDLGTGEQNIKIHRSRVMRKMGMESVAGLVRAMQRLAPGGTAETGKI
ncbi:MAG: LuxR family transcriptional regulator [Verrucomicrobiales bacterium]|nr:LuxR family transcriptional regulator [Verrucomicrobiales bacterium]